MPDRSIRAPGRAPDAGTARFSAAQCEALLGAVAAHDSIDLAAELPDVPHFGYDAALLSRSYWIARQLWRSVDRVTVARLAARLAAERRLDPQAALRLRDIRARAKQLRFAYTMLSSVHTYPTKLDRLTRLMGQAQDAMRVGRPVMVRVRGLQLQLATTQRQWAALDDELDRFVVTSPAGLDAYLIREIAAVKRALSEPAITDKAFHDTRKVVSRLVAFYDTLTVLAPSPDHVAVDRYLSTINGQMGAMHDDMAIGKARSRKGYHAERRPLPADIAKRLGRLVSVFEAAQRRG